MDPEYSEWMSNIKTVNNTYRQGCLNPSLFLNKYFPWKLKGKIPVNKDGKKNLKAIHFDKVIDTKLPIESEYYYYLKKRKNSLPGTVTFCLTTKKKMIINHGGESIFENSIALHPYYGFPIIPGSAIKGVSRHYYEEGYHCKEVLSNEDINLIFGKNAILDEVNLDDVNRKGCIIFLDAWPKKAEDNLFKLLYRDVFTPQYWDYYQGKEEFPIDNQDPNPVDFLTVRKGVEFEFAIAPSKKYGNESLDVYCETAKKIIIETLKNVGIGAKTGSDYGYFK